MSFQKPLQDPPIPDKIKLKITEDKSIELDILSIPLSKLKLDPNNVRFKHIDDPMIDEQIEEFIWRETDTKSTLREIKFSQGLSELPYVKKISDSEYLVIEGNRRLVCLRRLHDEISSRKEKNIPIEKIDPQQCYVFPENTDDATLAIFLARIHVSGKKDWPSMNKGIHVNDLINKYGYDWDQVIQATSIGRNTISQMLKAYETTKQYQKKYPDDESWLHRYSHFLELYKRRNLKDWIDNPKYLEKFMQWVNNGQIPMAIQVRKLDKIILEKDAYNAIQNGASVLEAEQIVKNSIKRKNLSDSTSGNIDSRLEDFQDFMKNFPRGKMTEISKDEEKLKNMETAHKEFGRLIKEIKTFGGH